MNEEDYEDTYSCHHLSYAMEMLPFNVAILRGGLCGEDRNHKALDHALESHSKLCEMALVIEQCVDEGYDNEALYEAYNQFRRGLAWDD